MDHLLVLIWIYLGGTVLFTTVLLFGESPYFRGTPIQWSHHLITVRIWELLEDLIICCCGRKAAERVGGILESCCETKSPAMAITYTLIMLIGFLLYSASLFSLLPNPWVPAWHHYTGTATFFLALVAFVSCSRSDPGTINPTNLHLHQALYQCDGQLWPEKKCTTCEFERPARSKHCRLCKRCFARFDHHCAWINNCVGLGNTRLFLLFLFSNLLVCLYGSILGSFILVGEMSRVGLLTHRTMNWRTGEQEWFISKPLNVIQWLLYVYPIASGLSIFLFFSFFLVLAFLGYQLYLISKGKTQYETFRWIDLHNQMLQEEEERGKVADGESGVKSGLRKLLLRLFCWPFVGQVKSSGKKRYVVLPPNPYDRGIYTNFYEILFWEAALEKAAAFNKLGKEIVTRVEANQLMGDEEKKRKDAREQKKRR